MRVIELSNHPGDMLHDVSLRRHATQRRAQAQYEDALIQHQARVQVIRVQRARARQNHRWWTWLRLIVAVWTEQRHAPAKPNRNAGDTDTEEKIKAGIAGEQLVATELGRALNDDWTLLRGYRNRRGEIDHLLLGPKGLFAIEVKNINATVSIDGDRWQADKYDNYGNLVEQREVADRTGRSPSEQLNERPASWSGSCTNAASGSPSSAWWSSPTAGRGSAPAATPPSTSAPRPITC